MSWLCMEDPRAATANLCLALVEPILYAHVREDGLHLPQILRLCLRMRLGAAVFNKGTYVSNDGWVNLVVRKPPVQDLRRVPEFSQIAAKASGVNVAIRMST